MAAPASIGTASAIGKKTGRRKMRSADSGELVIVTLGDRRASNQPAMPWSTPARDARSDAETAERQGMVDHQVERRRGHRRGQHVLRPQARWIAGVGSHFEGRRAVEVRRASFPEAQPAV